MIRPMRHQVLLGLIVMQVFLGAHAVQADDQVEVNSLLRDLSRSELGIRREAAIQLAGRKALPPTMAPTLFQHALEAEDSGVSCCLWRALGATGPRSAPHFAEALKNKRGGDDSGERSCIVLGLARLAANSPEAVLLLKDVAMGDEENPALEAVSGLWKAGAPIASGALADLLSSPDAALRWRTFRGLKYSEASIPPDLVARVRERLADPDVRVQASAAASLVMQQVHLGEARGVLLQALKAELDWLVEYWVADALGELGAQAAPAVPDLGRLLLESPHGNGPAARALGRIGTPDAVESLIKVAVAPEHGNRRECVLALGQAAKKMPEKVLPTLMQLCGDESAGIRIAASEALAAVGEPAIPTLLAALKDEDMYVRESAAHALQEIGSSRRDVIDALLDAAVDPFPMAAAYASLALYELKDAAVVEELTRRRKLESDRRATDPTRASEPAVISEDKLRKSLAPTGEYKYAAELDTFERFRMSGAGELLVSVHKGKDRPEILRIWTSAPGGFALLQRMDVEPGIAWFEKPRVFRHSGESFLHVRKRYDGTGRAYEDFIWTLSPACLLVKVEIEQPFPLKLEPGENSTRWNVEYADDLATFEFAVSIIGDPNCCPSGGRIIGTLKFVKQTGQGSGREGECVDKWVVKMDSYRRLPATVN